ncbi:MAG: glucose-6-phosphate dehydrogenase [Naasia sp.]
MTSSSSGSDPVSLVILGGGGDLTKRLLLPGLASLLSQHPRPIQIVGAGLEESDDAAWRTLIHDSFDSASHHPQVDLDLESLEHDAVWVTADVTDADQLQKIFDACTGTPVLYFALPPAVTAKVCAALAGMDVPDGLRLALEKPFGTDLTSSRELNRLISRIVPESQVFRIDHFLGKSTVLNIVGLRFSNALLQGVWSNDLVESVEIVYDEALGLEGRAGYYDDAGALIDMVQSHLLQVLAILAMEPLPRLDEIELRSNAAQVLRNTRVWDGDAVAASRRARYTAGTVGGKDLPSYAEAEGVDPDRGTETLAQVTFEVDTPRWRGVPFVLRSGKALGTARKEVSVRLRPAARIEGLAGAPAGDRIVLDMAHDAITLELTMNGSGDPFTLERNTMTVTKEPGDLLPYGQVLQGILDGDPLLSVRDDVAAECWRIVEPVLAAWHRDRVPLEEYRAGSAGPDSWGEDVRQGQDD